MVAFICDACGNTVKKNQVEKHYTNQCRSCSMLSCIDCGVDFPGDTYINHNTCMTEAEKYQGHLYQAKDKENKGEMKQKEWLKQVHGASSNMHDPKLKGLLQKLSAYSNIPRKKKKFENFCKNSVNVYDSKTLDALWDVFNAGRSTVIEATEETKQSMENGSDAGSHGDTVENVDASSHPQTAETDSTNMETDTIEDESSNGESFTKVTRKKKKKKHSLTNQDDNSSGESQTVDVPQVQSSGNVVETTNMSDDTVENNECCDIVEDNSETQSKKKKKYKEKHTVEEQVENIASELESQSIEPKQNKKKKKKLNGLCENGVIINGAANNSESGNHKHETKKQKAKKRKKERLEESQLVRKKKREEKQSDGEEHLPAVESDKEEVVPQGKFSWHKAIKTILKESENHEISVKKLKKKVLDAYQEHGIDHRAPTMDESRALFDKKLKTYPKAQVAKEIVKLIK